MEETEKLSILNFYRDIRKNSISLTFQGIMSQDVLSLIGMTLKRRSDNEVVAKRLFGIVVELTQNIYHYSAARAFSEKDSKEIGVGVVTIGETDEHYEVNSGNMMFSEGVKQLTERCDFINSLDAEGLKKFHKEQLHMPQRDDKPGANVGLIDLARKSRNKLTYLINKSDNDLSFLTLSIRINK